MGHSEHGSQGFYSPSSTPDAQLVGGRSPLPFFENRKKVPDFTKKVPCLCASMGSVLI